MEIDRWGGVLGTEKILNEHHRDFPRERDGVVIGIRCDTWIQRIQEPHERQEKPLNRFWSPPPRLGEGGQSVRGGPRALRKALPSMMTRARLYCSRSSVSILSRVAKSLWGNGAGDFFSAVENQMNAPRRGSPRHALARGKKAQVCVRVRGSVGRVSQCSSMAKATVV